MEVLSEAKGVCREGRRVRRPAQPWSEDTFRFVRHLEGCGLPVEHMIGIEGGCEVSEFAEGEMVHPHKWCDEALSEVGKLLARLHGAGAEFAASGWKPWYLREIGAVDGRIWCHGDIAPWNMVTDKGFPKALIDWEFSGPLDPLVELARVCWLFPQLVDDDLGERYDLPGAEKRAEQVVLICDGYGLPREKRRELTTRIIEVIICETAHEAIDPGITFSGKGDLWGFAWRTRSLYWVWRNRNILERKLQ